MPSPVVVGVAAWRAPARSTAYGVISSIAVGGKYERRRAGLPRPAALSDLIVDDAT